MLRYFSLYGGASDEKIYGEDSLFEQVGLNQFTNMCMHVMLVQAILLLPNSEIRSRRLMAVSE